ncbi:MAG: sigma-70 family RNA polymerase sigma factor [Polyangia bacterium]
MPEHRSEKTSEDERSYVRETDESLYHRVRRGDLRAFDALYGRYETRLFGFLCHMLRSPHDAEDLFHETFLSVLRSREVTFDRGSFAAWLYRVARNRALNHLRSGQRGVQAMRRIEAPESPPSAEHHLIERSGERERAAALTAAVAALPDALSELYRMRTAGLSYDEMAAALRIPLGTVKSRMNQMTSRLRRSLVEQLEPPDGHGGGHGDGHGDGAGAPQATLSAEFLCDEEDPRRSQRTSAGS